MAFANYTCVDDVVKKHRLMMAQAPLVVPASDAPAFSAHFRAELDFNLRKLPIGRSEIGSGEIILFPILREVWKPYVDELALFTHEPLHFDNDLTGIPDYFVCRVSEYGQTIPDLPYLLVVEAKLDDFERAWGQCLAAMLAAQKLNGLPEMPVYGITTNSDAWKFGRLLGREVTLDPSAVALANLDTLGQSLHAIFRMCRDMARAHPVSIG